MRSRLKAARSVIAFPSISPTSTSSARTVTVNGADWRASSPTRRDLKNPDSVTMQEEEKIAAFFGGGTLYATPARAEPLL